MTEFILGAVVMFFGVLVGASINYRPDNKKEIEK